MRLSTNVGFNGNVNPDIVARRLREMADAVEAAAAAMDAIGSTTPTIPGGQNLTFEIAVEGSI